MKRIGMSKESSTFIRLLKKAKQYLLDIKADRKKRKHFIFCVFAMPLAFIVYMSEFLDTFEMRIVRRHTPHTHSYSTMALHIGNIIWQHAMNE